MFQVIGLTCIFMNINKLAIQIDENGHSERNIDYGIKRQKAIEQELDCKFIRIDPDKENFCIFKTINETLKHLNNRLNKH